VIRVLLVNEIRLMCNAIAAVLEEEPDIEVAECAPSVERALQRASESDVMLVSTGLADNGALSLITQMAESHPSVRVLALGLTETEEQIVPYVEAGAHGYVLNDSSVDELLARIRAPCGDQALIIRRQSAI
jgi:DNA-binding NarL/FixJ family response regulator